MAYLGAFSTFHICVRLGLIVSYKKDQPWWNLEKCVANDYAGVTLELSQRLCVKASRWAFRSPLLKTLAPWFETVSRHLEQL